MKTFVLLILPLALLACSEKETDTATDDTGTEDTDTDDTASEDTEEDTSHPDSFILEDFLERPSGCSDFLFFDRNTDDTIVLELQGQGLAEAAHASGGAQTFTHDLAALSADFRLEVNFGTNISYELCNDALDPNIVRVLDTKYLPVNGRMTLTITPNGEPMGMGDFPAELHIQIQGADFCADTGDGSTHHENCFNVNDYSATASIGWLPG
ncbi:MAG: hypothetical protein VX278_21690 [Myxococcota bacterium]|nr:hypothetical protein [Myxococcota bacterium]